MFFLIILFLGGLFLHKMCSDKGVSPWGYIGAFVAGFMGIIILTAIATIALYGPDIMKHPDAQKEVQSLSPFAMLFQVLLFLYFRRRIEKIPDYTEDEEENNKPSGEKKDLSYFR